MHMIIAGLGNYGSHYAATRHNVGFMAVDAIKTKVSGQDFVSKFNSEAAVCTTSSGSKILLLKPKTYMNLSGNALGPALAFYKLPPAHLVVIHDDIDLPLGTVKYKLGGGDGGHNGLRSVDRVIGKNYVRIRIGVGRPEHGDVSDFVLGKFLPQELEKITKINDAIADNIELLLGGKQDSFIQIITKES